jgi:hypothetical protein
MAIVTFKFVSVSRPTSSSKPIPEPNNYPNPITTPTASAKDAKMSVNTPKLNLDNLAVIKVIAAALQEYITIKEHGQ